MVGGPQHHSVYANSRQCPEKEQSGYGPERFTYQPESNTLSSVLQESN